VACWVDVIDVRVMAAAAVQHLPDDTDSLTENNVDILFCNQTSLFDFDDYSTVQ
jgi:hypothetical protein